MASVSRMRSTIDSLIIVPRAPALMTISSCCAVASSKNTGNGHREGGEAVYEFFSEPKTVYVDYSRKLQRAQIDNR